jgi:uncharacterized protein involved in exopolysaccharide biosynthesis
MSPRGDKEPSRGSYKSITLFAPTFVVALLTFLLTLGAGLILPRTFTVRAMLVADAGRSGSVAGSLAAQFGINLTPAGGQIGAPLLAEVVQSGPFLRRMVTMYVPVATGSDSLLLSEVLRAKGDSERERTEDALDLLREKLTAVVDRKTGALRVAVQLSDPRTAYAVAEAVLSGIQDFNVSVRQSQARAERIFSEERLAAARIELRSAEDSLQSFLRRNRSWRESPDLAFQQERLAREVSLREQVLVSLAQSYEQSRVDEVRDTPAITIVERPELPARPDGPSPLVVALVAGAFGALVQLVVSLLVRLGIFRSLRPRIRALVETLSTVE